MLKELFPGSTDFTVAMFKIPQMSKHFSAMLYAAENVEFKFSPLRRHLKANSHDAIVVTTCSIQLISHRENAKIAPNLVN